ncbi:MAG: carboxypeptidase M32, partial [Alphaproteobacteria bacterium]|nr:carboxypeptidase M32 [Alphaproteobacteria bacterium]
MSAYRQLAARYRRIAVIDGAQAVLHWDRAVMMPPGGADARTEQLAALSAVAHELLTDATMGPQLDEAEQIERPTLDPWAAANLREMRRKWRHATAVPADLVEAISRAASACEMIWRSARAANDFAAVRPALDQLLRLVRQQAAAKAAAFGTTPYAAMLDAYDPGQEVATIDRLFGELAGILPGILDRVLGRQRREAPPLPFDGDIDHDGQRRLGEELMRAVGFDTDF